MWIGKLWRYILLFMVVSFPAAPAAQAKKLMVIAAPEANGFLKVEAFFPDGAPAREIPITIFAENGRGPLHGKTNQEGTFRVIPLGPGDYRVMAGDPRGHQAEIRVKVGDGETAAAPGSPPPAGARNAASKGASPEGGEAVSRTDILAGLGFIFGLAGLIMGLKLQRDLRKLRRKRRASSD